MEITQRTGLFTSSQIYKLMKNGRSKESVGAPFYTYVNEKKREILVGRQISNEARATSTDWGNMMEKFVFESIGLEYELTSKKRYFHLELPWSGMPDTLTKDTVSDIKCPWTLTSFMETYEAMCSEDIELFIATCDDYFWQLISNAILTDKPFAELILFMPKNDMLAKIRGISEESGKYYFHLKYDMELPWTSNESKIPVITKFKFPVLQEYKDQLIERVSLASNLLNK